MLMLLAPLISLGEDVVEGVVSAVVEAAEKHVEEVLEEDLGGVVPCLLNTS